MFPVVGNDLSKSVAMLKLLVQHDRFAGLFVHEEEARDSMSSVDGTAAAREDEANSEAANRGWVPFLTSKNYSPSFMDLYTFFNGKVRGGKKRFPQFGKLLAFLTAADFICSGAITVQPSIANVARVVAEVDAGAVKNLKAFKIVGQNPSLDERANAFESLFRAVEPLVQNSQRLH